MTIQADIQKLNGEDIVELFELDLTPFGGSLFAFYAGTNQLNTTLTWQGFLYQPFPMEVTGFEFTGTGKIPRPIMKMHNVDGLIGATADFYQDLVGAVLTRKRTFVKYLDAVNFPGGVNPTADPTAEFPHDIYTVSRKTSHNKTMIEWELTSAMDVHGVRLPRRQILQHTCTWVYRSGECSYAGGAVATIDDVPTTNLALDACGKRLASCKMRFGSTAPLPFGGFPGAGIVG